jgi:cobalamin biosynthesis protein CbiD
MEMERNMALTKEQMDARLEMIKAAAKRVAAKKEFKRRQAINAATVRRWTDEVEKPRRKKISDEIDSLIDKLDENYNHWTDGEKYAETHYGDVARNTTKYDNDWD